MTRRETCRVCAGSGRARGAGGQLRRLCRVPAARDRCAGTWCSRGAVSACGGTGQQRPRPCEPCGGTGLRDAGRDDASADSAPESPTATRCGWRAVATPVQRGGPAGDLYLTVQVAPHPVFRRERNDLHTFVDVGIHEAALGARITDARAGRRGAAARSAGHAVGTAIPRQWPWHAVVARRPSAVI